MTQTTTDDTHTDSDTRARLIPRLPRTAVIILLGDAVSAVGVGMSMPFLLIYLTHPTRNRPDHRRPGASHLRAGIILGNPLGGRAHRPAGPRSCCRQPDVLRCRGSDLHLGHHAPLAFRPRPCSDWATPSPGPRSTPCWPPSSHPSNAPLHSRYARHLERRSWPWARWWPASSSTPPGPGRSSRVPHRRRRHSSCSSPCCCSSPPAAPTANPQTSNRQAGYRGVLPTARSCRSSGSPRFGHLGFAQYHSAFPAGPPATAVSQSAHWAPALPPTPPPSSCCNYPMLRALTGRKRTTAISWPRSAGPGLAAGVGVRPHRLRLVASPASSPP